MKILTRQQQDTLLDFIVEQYLVANIDKKREAFARALGVMQTLRSDCPWDAKQDNESIRRVVEIRSLGCGSSS